MSDDRVTRRRFVGAGAAAALAATAQAAAPKAGEMHYGILGGVKISRLILGANPMGGGAHSRDLLYMSKLMRAYNTEERLLDLLKIAESEGVNAVLHGNVGLIRKHKAACGLKANKPGKARRRRVAAHRPGSLHPECWKGKTR